jgi:sugar-specific transcriptional regulator TrmB
MLLSDLQELGLSDEEAKVYLAVLELGGSYVSAIGKKAGVHRVACYYTLDKLTKKGMLSSFTKNKMKYFSVESPQILVNQMEEKYEKAKSMLPELLSITNAMAYKPKIQYYEGLAGIKNLLEVLLNAKSEIVGYTNLEEIPKVIPVDYLKMIAERKTKAGIKTRMLSPLTEDALCYLDTYYPEDFDRNLVEILFINPEEYPFEYEVNIYDDFVSVISLNPDELIGMIIESALYAKTQRSVFNLAWRGATSFVAR